MLKILVLTVIARIKKQQHSFTLFELLIVVLIIGISYTLILNNFRTQKDESKYLSFLNLRSMLVENKQANEIITIRCFEDSKKCAIFKDDVLDGEDFDWFFSEDVIFYHIDQYQTAQKIEFPIFIDEDKREETVIFEYSINTKGASDDIFVEDMDTIYFLGSFFEEAKRIKSIDEVIEHREVLFKKVND